IRKHYEVWFFTYNTGNPIPVSANVLRHSLEDAVQSLGGVQADPALGRMVVIGHSQGGLLTKLISIDSGTKLWDAISEKPGDELKYRTFNSISGMSPGNPAIEALRKIPVAPGIHAYSIIPTLQDGPLETRDDGVVEYKSAHIDGVRSELVIEHSGHSTQGNPLTVREIRRILLLHLAEACPQGCTPVADRPPVATGQ